MRSSAGCERTGGCKGGRKRDKQAIDSIHLLDLTLWGNSMKLYNATAIGEDRATLGSDPSAEASG